MNWKLFLAGVGVGLIGGYAAREIIAEKTKVSPEKVLDHAKAVFKRMGPVSGSWIQMKTEPYAKNGLEYEVYKGGVSRTIDGDVEQYEFIADASTGTILEAYPFHA